MVAEEWSSPWIASAYPFPLGGGTLTRRTPPVRSYVCTSVRSTVRSVVYRGAWYIRTEGMRAVAVGTV